MPANVDHPPALLEVVTPRANATPLSAVARMLAACALSEPLSLEIAGTPAGRSFLVRSQPHCLAHLEGQLAAAYPQATLRPLTPASHRALDPAWRRDDEQVAVCGLLLAAPIYLPLRTFDDDRRPGEATAEADPILGVLAAHAGLPAGWRTLCQLLLRPARPEWAAPYARMALERPFDAAPTAAAGPSWAGVVAMGGLVAALAAFPAVAGWYDARDWLRLGLAGGGAATGLPLAAVLRQRCTPPAPSDPLLIREKLAHVAFAVQLRLSVFAPADAPAQQLVQRLERLGAAYGPFTLPRGNALVPCALQAAGQNLAALRPLPARRSRRQLSIARGGAEALLNVQELAGLWHLPIGEADVPLLERTTARRWQPLPATVARGCRIGSSGDVPVALAADLLRRHLLLVAKTRRGKSSLLLRLAQHAMQQQAGMAPALVLVDPHHDLARAALGLVPAGRQDQVVYLDLAEQAHPVGLNLLDTGLGWDAERAVANALSVFRHQWDQYWGPRMEDIFRMVLLTLYTANEARCAANPGARDEQYTVLEVPLLLVDLVFRQQVVAEGGDAFVKEWWQVFFDKLLDRRLQIESINPVLTKINRLAASGVTRALVGQSRSTITPGAWLRDGQIVLVHTAQGIVGEDTAALLGGTILNLLKLEVHAQAALPPAQRRAVTVIVDEFHTIPGADYEAFLGELAKYGANLVLATQTLARLEAIDRAHERALRATLFSNLDGLFAFHCSAEDAKYLAPELGDEVEVADLVSLGEHRCYARLSGGGERLPVFSLALDPPPAGDAALAEQLATQAARRSGRPRQQVLAVRAALRARIDAVRQAAMAAAQRRQEDPPPIPSKGNASTPQPGQSPSLQTARLPLDDAPAPTQAAPAKETERQEGAE